MQPARNPLCAACLTPIPGGHRFCARCGAGVPDAILGLQTRFFSELQDPAKARLVLIRGDGLDGLSFHLKAERHSLGRAGQLDFPDDAFLSRRHANLFYAEGRLFVRDEGSLNGVYLRLREPTRVGDGAMFLAGEHVFRVTLAPPVPDEDPASTTTFYASPPRPSDFRVTELLEDGRLGCSLGAGESGLCVGRVDADFCFPTDALVSEHHCRLDHQSDALVLSDLDSRNGTYLRIHEETPLTHGDMLFVGRKLFRVELMS